MISTKYIGMDVHKESISIAVRNAAGKIVMECVIETKASIILQFIDGLRGDVQVTFEEDTSAAWLHDLLKPRVTKLVVCGPRKNKSMREGNQSYKIDARRLAELLRLGHLTSGYHGELGLRTMKELVRSYLTITKDLARVMTRVKAIYRSWAIPCAGKEVYAARHRAEWLAKINEPGVPGGRNFTTCNSIHYGCCARKCEEICSGRAGSTKPGNGSAGSPRLARSGRRCCWAFCRPRIVFAPSGSCGITAVWLSRRTAVPITVASTDSSNGPGKTPWFAASTETASTS